MACGTTIFFFLFNLGTSVSGWLSENFTFQIGILKILFPSLPALPKSWNLNDASEVLPGLLQGPARNEIWDQGCL